MTIQELAKLVSENRPTGVSFYVDVTTRHTWQPAGNGQDAKHGEYRSAQILRSKGGEILAVARIGLNSDTNEVSYIMPEDDIKVSDLPRGIFKTGLI